MPSDAPWSKEAFEASVTSRCWWYTPYDEGWDKCPAMAEDEELRGIVAMEAALGGVPEWAQQTVDRSIQRACPCGHYLFPRPYLEALDSIGSQTPPTFVHGCFTVDGERKRGMMDYVLCLDAWLAGAAAEDAARELAALGHRRIDWDAVCRELWRVLGVHTELKDLLVERLLHSQRLKIKRSPWDDDLASAFGRDQFLGVIAKGENPPKLYSHIEADVPAFDEGASPRLQRMEARLEELCSEWGKMRFHITFGWLCAPKAFRFLERLVWAIGQERPPQPGDRVPGFLQIDDTHPNQDEAAAWWKAFVAALDAWWQGKPASGPVANDVGRRLGEPTPVKCWLVRLLRRKLRFCASYEEGLDRLINARAGARPGPVAAGREQPVRPVPDVDGAARTPGRGRRGAQYGRSGLGLSPGRDDAGRPRGGRAVPAGHPLAGQAVQEGTRRSGHAVPVWRSRRASGDPAGLRPVAGPGDAPRRRLLREPDRRRADPPRGPRRSASAREGPLRPRQRAVRRGQSPGVAPVRGTGCVLRLAQLPPGRDEGDVGGRRAARGQADARGRGVHPPRRPLPRDPQALPVEPSQREADREAVPGHPPPVHDGMRHRRPRPARRSDAGGAGVRREHRRRPRPAAVEAEREGPVDRRRPGPLGPLDAGQGPAGGTRR